jgi:membrane protein YqaA with SNARE-associated domain
MLLPFALAGGALLVIAGIALVSNALGATDWWIGYSARERTPTGRGGSAYDRGSTRALGLVALLFGLTFITVALSAT